MDEKSSSQVNVIILIPVYNDWDSLRVLLRDLSDVAARTGIQPTIVVVNDGSNQRSEVSLATDQLLEPLKDIEIIHLHLNLGHQSAIAVGLCEVLRRYEGQSVIVMDADGEDRPEDIERFIRTHHESPESIIVAKRSRRSEGIAFRFLYGIYKLVFRLFVGKNLDFGNFCLIPGMLVDRLAYDPMTWNHLAATISRSELNVVKLNTNRGVRYQGQSSMSFQGLVSHGLSAVSVFLDIAMIRVLILTSVLMLAALSGILTVLYFRLFTDLAIPGWATSAVGVLSIIGLQGLILSTLAAFLVLRGRSGISLIPAIDGSKFVKSIEHLMSHD